MASRDVTAEAAAAIEAGELVLLPTDGVYGLCAAPRDEAAAQRLYALKGRAGSQPAAVLAASVATLLAWLPELGEDGEALVRALLPGPYTLVLPNPARRFAWLTGTRPDTIGVRVARLPASSQAVLDAVSAVAATSANLPGGPDPARLDDVPAPIRDGCRVAVDGGVLPGRPSTVIDFTARDPVVLRSGAGAVAEALARAAAVRGRS